MSLNFTKTNGFFQVENSFGDIVFATNEPVVFEALEDNISNSSGVTIKTISESNFFTKTQFGLIGGVAAGSTPTLIIEQLETLLN